MYKERKRERERERGRRDRKICGLERIWEDKRGEREREK